MTEPAVTIVLATYGRPDTLRFAIQSVLLQTWPHWRLLVIGDHCDAETEAAVNAFSDPRIRFVNLPTRAGEQSGPNSVGMALAQTRYLAFLNHDDLWLKDHLEYGLTALERSGADFHMGTSAFAFQTTTNGQGQVKPLFGHIHGEKRHPAWSASPVTPAHARMFEPASAWILRTAPATEVGWWKGREAFISLFPLQDWVRRAWRKGLRFEFGSRLTVLKITTQYRPADTSPHGAYAAASEEHAYLYPLLETATPDAFRRMILDEVASAQADNSVGRRLRRQLALWRKNPASALARLAQKTVYFTLSPVTMWAYARFGIDPRDALLRFLYRLLGKTPGQSLARVVRMRTGETFTREHDIDTIVQMTLEMEKV